VARKCAGKLLDRLQFVATLKLAPPETADWSWRSDGARAPRINEKTSVRVLPLQRYE
jgi:hypothetical protein